MIRVRSNNSNGWIVVVGSSSILLLATVTAVTTTTILMLLYNKYKRNNNNERNSNNNNNKSSIMNDDNYNHELMIYLDYNGTTPIYKYVLNAMLPYLTIHYGNPSSTHIGGTIPKYAMNYSRYQILHYLLHCTNVEIPIHPTSTSNLTTCTNSSTCVDNNNNNNDSSSSSPTSSVSTKNNESNCSDMTTTITTTITTPLSSCIFTSCGTEADNMMIHFAIQLYHIRQPQQQQQVPPKDSTISLLLPHIITSNIEHPAIDVCLSYYEQQKQCIVSRIPVQSNGQIRTSDVINAIQSNTYVYIFSFFCFIFFYLLLYIFFLTLNKFFLFFYACKSLIYDSNK
jgi:hypothetical protein